jgi:hypothetical protein
MQAYVYVYNVVLCTLFYRVRPHTEQVQCFKLTGSLSSYVVIYFDARISFIVLCVIPVLPF